MTRNYMAEQGLTDDEPLPTRPRKKHKKGDAPDREWRLQAMCVKRIKVKMRADPDLEYLATMAEGLRDPGRAAVAQMMGLKSGPSDILLFRRFVFPLGPQGLKIAWVELKLPGKWLSESQKKWHAWFAMVGVECHRVDSVADFQGILDAF